MALNQSFYLSLITILATVFYVAFAAITQNIIMLSAPIGALLLIVSIKLPRLIGYMFILSSINFLGFFNPETIFHIPGAFKFIDLLYAGLLLVYIIDVLHKKDRTKLISHSAKVIPVIGISLLILVAVQIIITTIRFELPMLSSIKVGRNYLYFFFLFYLIRFFNTERLQRQLISFVFLISLIQFSLLILQQLGINPAASTLIRTLEIGESSVTRVYIPGYFYSLLTLATCLAFLCSSIKYKRNIIFFVLIFTAIASILLSYTRTYWVSAALVFLLCFFLSDKNNKTSRLIYTLMAAVPIIIFLSAFNFSSNLLERFLSIFSDIASGDGNFIYRFTENPRRIEAFLNYPLLGPGFVHSDYAAQLFNFTVNTSGKSDEAIQRALLLQTNDSGLITLLVSFGVIGVLGVLYKIYNILAIYKRSKSYVSSASRTVILGSVSFIIATWMTCATTYGFTYPDGLVSLTIALYFIYSTCALSRHSRSNNNPLGFRLLPNTNSLQTP